ncbi:hypothetical protein [Pedobacter sp. B4-66]|uniref:hypothetical protein n=1 Tax=Pedobacter sp. B4-66 TaxID=2817280 RepID=UPI001BDB0B60|nr:hypothetical protein [Pedobacter sp. B4-66]
MAKRESSILDATELLKTKGGLFTEVFKHGTLLVEFYKPEKVDMQKPHDRDEIYVVASGTGTFINGEKSGNFNQETFCLFLPVSIIDLKIFLTTLVHGCFFMDPLVVNNSLTRIYNLRFLKLPENRS